jgi:hypothetical protein
LPVRALLGGRRRRAPPYGAVGRPSRLRRVADRLPRTIEQRSELLDRELEADWVVAAPAGPFSGDPVAAMTIAAEWLDRATGGRAAGAAPTPAVYARAAGGCGPAPRRPRGPGCAAPARGSPRRHGGCAPAARSARATHSGCAAASSVGACPRHQQEHQAQIKSGTACLEICRSGTLVPGTKDIGPLHMRNGAPTCDPSLG